MKIQSESYRMNKRWQDGESGGSPPSPFPDSMVTSSHIISIGESSKPYVLSQTWYNYFPEFNPVAKTNKPAEVIVTFPMMYPPNNQANIVLSGVITYPGISQTIELPYRFESSQTLPTDTPRVAFTVNPPLPSGVRLPGYITIKYEVFPRDISTGAHLPTGFVGSIGVSVRYYKAR